MSRLRGARRRSRSAKKWWAATAIVVALSVGAGVIIAVGNHGPGGQEAFQTSAWVRWDSGGFGRGGYVMARPGHRVTVSATTTPVSQQARQQLSVTRETKQQFLASYNRSHAQQYQSYIKNRRGLEQQYQNLLKQYEKLLKQYQRNHHRTPPPVVTPTVTPTASSTVTATATPTASATTAPVTMPTATATATQSATATPTATTASATPTATATSATAMPTTTTASATPTATTSTATPTATATTAAPTATATATSSATATATATPTATTSTATPTATATVTPTVTPTTTTTTTTGGVTQANSPNWAGYAATGAAGTFTSVAANWIVPPLSCGAVVSAARSSDAAGLDGDGTNTIEQIGTEADCDGNFPVYSGWYQVSPNAPVFFTNPVKAGDVMTASVTALGGGNFMLTLFDMTQNWTQVTQQTVAAATEGSAEIVAQDPSQNGAVQLLSNFGLIDFTDVAINNAAIAAPINELTMVSAAGNTLAVPSTITGGGVGNFSVGWDASA